MRHGFSFTCKQLYSEDGKCKYVREKGRASPVFSWNLILSTPLGTLNWSAWCPMKGHELLEAHGKQCP